jgi:cytochrome c-type biogenesis protein CcmF
VLGSVSLIGWRADRLRSPGSIDSPISREGAFLANNVLFAAFAFVVLLGTVFPLVLEAANGERISIGRPYFDRMTMPIGIALLFLMAVAPVLPWRKASGELLRHRLVWPAWIGTGVVVIAVAFGARGLAPLLAFGLGGFAAGSALRQIVLATRRQGWHGLVGRANGGMIVHVGVVIIAVALAASSSYSHSGEFLLAPGESATLAGHRITYLGIERAEEEAKTVTRARVQIDGGQIYEPALSRFPGGSNTIGTPSVRTGITGDVYLTLLDVPDEEDGQARIGMLVMPLAVWLWIGGTVMAMGTLLAAWPGRRRRPTDPVSAPVPEREPAAPGEPVGEPVGAGVDG